MLRLQSVDGLMRLLLFQTNNQQICSNLARMTGSLMQNCASSSRRPTSICEASPSRSCSHHACKHGKVGLSNTVSMFTCDIRESNKSFNRLSIPAHVDRRLNLRFLDTGQSTSSHSYLTKKQCFHTSASSHGLQEFFEDEKNLGEDKVGSGRAWHVEELRLKDNVTLHKLWYVLLKERNMLMTMEEEAERKEVYMPSPERLDKVKISMNNIKQVTKERDEALNELKTGQKELHPGRWEKTIFGYLRYVRPQEHILPIQMNKHYATKRRKYGGYMIKHMRLWMENELGERRKNATRARKRDSKLRKKFPNSDYWKED